MIIRTQQQGDVVVLTIDNPPVNAGNAEQRAGLAAAITDALAVPGLSGIVIASAGPHFYAGSDLGEFDGELASPTLPEVIALVESAPVPFVAAVKGLALGGGLELALACDRRVVDSSARLGFPEVRFGILPGAGGTVRAARLVGPAAAVEMVTSARQVDAEEARKVGLVDRVVDPADLITAAVETVRGLDGRDLIRDRTAPRDESATVEAALAAIPRRARPNVRRAADLVVRGARLDADTALAEERAAFDELRRTPESQDLRYLFFAQQDAARSLRTSAAPAHVGRVGIVGAGTMGKGLAVLFAGRGYDVTVVDGQQEALDRVAAAVPSAAVSDSLTALGEVDLVVDAVFEDMSVKQDLLRELEPIVPPSATIASNTSYLDLDEIATVLADPSRFAGLHFFNPPERNALVEVIPAARTSEAHTATLGSVVRRLGKIGIRAGVGDGFVGNRVYADYRGQAEFLLEEGANVEDVDAAMVDLGFAIGPFAVADMSGLDIAWARRKRLALTRDPGQRYVRIPDLVCEAGRLGRKTGAGWYDYPEGAKRGVPSPAVQELVDRARAEQHIIPRAIGADEIKDRVLGSMLAAAATLVSVGVTAQASDIDVALTEGFAFPRHLGGPLRTLSRRPESAVVAILAQVHASDPIGFSILEPATAGVLPLPVRTVLDSVRPATTTHEGVDA
ncbi:3-hydroxyacyl-CoA dehydrogenase [Geodermatophilus africanus]|uniref:3-hydroxyacyl-CoA dehydrogenase n=1 Tax=Geodermatophilus africanus TaxID=1137993 RepID=A0A1H3PKF7_9ACTN|nr:3-hydroxyacyl-CoA dehydrogenase NAD-binding domain-containing protein [Geodermatophilus africanus]SDZ01520.1 3-hydroxyacyl-CoA dehydrogenase [Geodermatophilus africanus]